MTAHIDGIALRKYGHLLCLPKEKIDPPYIRTDDKNSLKLSSAVFPFSMTFLHFSSWNGHNAGVEKNICTIKIEHINFGKLLLCSLVSINWFNKILTQVTPQTYRC